MKIGVVGCVHGELEVVYKSLDSMEEKENTKIELLLCCGDFEGLRNENDLQCMATKNPKMGSFYKYYSGEKVAPVLTIFIGGNHEASNYLQELPFGGWVAPNIYYLGYAGCVTFGGIRIAGISGIYKKYDYLKEHYEVTPYSETAKRSVYHIRQLEVFRLMQLSGKIDVCLSHDWPQNVDKFGDFNGLIESRPNLQEDIEGNRLGSPPTKMLLQLLQPSYWFSAHLHSFYKAVVQHTDSSLQTNFIALDKCCSDDYSDDENKFLEIVDMQTDDEQKHSAELSYDLEWLTILHQTNHLNNKIDMKSKLTPTKENKELIYKRFDYNLIIPMNFCRTAEPYDQLSKQQFPRQKKIQFNPQTATFCATLGI